MPALRAVLLVIPLAALAGCGDDPPAPEVGAAALPTNTVVQGFPAKAFPAKLAQSTKLFDAKNYTKCDTAWVVEWDITNPENGPNGGVYPSSVLRITAAHFMHRDKAGKPRWVTVVRDLEVGELLVPYDDGLNVYEDVAAFTYWVVEADPKLLAPACVGPGEILKSKKAGMGNKVYKELHDDGIRWLENSEGEGPDRGRRGEKMTLWVNFYADNYRYVMEYSFTDDGVIHARVAGTAENAFNRKPAPYVADAHPHIGCWTFDPILGDPTNPANGGADKNAVKVVRRVQQNPGPPDVAFKAETLPFPGTGGTKAVEGSAAWNAEQFTTLRIESGVRKNAHGRPTAYDLVPHRSGAVRNFPARYEYANRDFWVTPADPSYHTFRDVPTYISAPPRPIDNAPVRVWHTAALYHVPRGEDFGTDGVKAGQGVALTAWTGFSLKPRDLFDGSPLYKP